METRWLHQRQEKRQPRGIAASQWDRYACDYLARSVRAVL